MMDLDLQNSEARCWIHRILEQNVTEFWNIIGWIYQILKQNEEVQKRLTEMQNF